MKKIRLFSIALFLLLLNTYLTAQNISSVNYSAVPVFHFDVVSLASQENPELARVSIFSEVLYDDLSFLKTDSGFTAQYEVSATLWDGRDQVGGEIWNETVHVDNFDQTNSRRHVDVSYQYFEVEPDKYDVKFLVEDVNGTQLYEGEKTIRINDYSKNKLSASDVTFARQVEIDSTGELKGIFPEVTNQFKGLGSGAKAYYEIYNPKNADSAFIEYEIKGEKFKRNFEERIKLDGFKSAMYFIIPVDSLSNGKYNLDIQINAGREKYSVEKEFFIRYAGLPRTAKDLKVAISQLQYISTSKEWKKLKKAKGDERLYEFEKFWERRDPSSGTEYNENMATYYARVEAANQNFGVMGRDGWRTDRGMVFIILGPPDNVIREDYPANSKPYQIWQYYSINRQFEFFDETNFGDYRFVWPISVSELQRYAQMRNN